MAEVHMPDVTRRRVLGQGLACAALAATGGLTASRVSLAAPGAGERRFVFVILRGALDGLAAVPPVGDPDLERLRGTLALARPGNDGGALALDGFFALHPSLPFVHESWQARQLHVVHAVATPYRERSHFDAQDVLENGMTRAHASSSGWMNRALAGMPAAPGGGNSGVALGANIPLVMRGAVEVASWSPSRLPDIDADTLQRLGDLYSADPLLSMRLADAMAADSLAEEGAEMSSGNAGGNAGTRRVRGNGLAAQVVETAKATARFLAQPAGPRVAVFETTGWDTHANQGAGEGALALRLGALDRALRALRDTLGDTWQHTAVLVATEFGRTVAVNGTRGTDHGTATMALLLGGAVDGGRVSARWPGLAQSALYQGRDLAPTTDLRALMKTVLRDQLGVTSRHIDNEVFPDSAAAGYLPGLIRT